MADPRPVTVDLAMTLNGTEVSVQVEPSGNPGAGIARQVR